MPPYIYLKVLENYGFVIAGLHPTAISSIPESASRTIPFGENPLFSGPALRY